MRSWGKFYHKISTWKWQENESLPVFPILQHWIHKVVTIDCRGLTETGFLPENCSSSTCKASKRSSPASFPSASSQFLLASSSPSFICMGFFEFSLSLSMVWTKSSPSTYGSGDNEVHCRFWLVSAATSLLLSLQTSTSCQLEDAPLQFGCFWPRCTHLSTPLLLDAHLAPPTPTLSNLGEWASMNTTL